MLYRIFPIFVGKSEYKERMSKSNITDLKTVRLSEDADSVVLLDQTQLPEKEVYLSLSNAEDIWEAIYKLKDRGSGLWHLCLQQTDRGGWL